MYYNDIDMLMKEEGTNVNVILLLSVEDRYFAIFRKTTYIISEIRSCVQGVLVIKKEICLIYD